MTTTKLAEPTMANRPTVLKKNKNNAVSDDHIVTRMMTKGGNDRNFLKLIRPHSLNMDSIRSF